MTIPYISIYIYTNHVLTLCHVISLSKNALWDGCITYFLIFLLFFVNIVKQP